MQVGTERMKNADLHQLRRTMKNEEMFDRMFDLSEPDTRRCFVIKAKAGVCESCSVNLSTWRVVRMKNGND